MRQQAGQPSARGPAGTAISSCMAFGGMDLLLPLDVCGTYIKMFTVSRRNGDPWHCGETVPAYVYNRVVLINV